MKIKSTLLTTVSLFITSLAFGAEKKDMKTQLLEKIVDQSVIDEIERKENPMKNFSNILNVIKGVDPTRPEKRKPVEIAEPEEKEEEKDDDSDDAKPIKLSAIFFSENRKYAIINGQIVKEGQAINERVLKKIYKNKILIEDFDADKEIRLPGLKIVTTLEEAREQERIAKEKAEQEKLEQERLQHQLLEQEQQNK